jgi:hypothetical protein
VAVHDELDLDEPVVPSASRLWTGGVATNQFMGHRKVPGTGKRADLCRKFLILLAAGAGGCGNAGRGRPHGVVGVHTPPLARS